MFHYKLCNYSLLASFFLALVNFNPNAMVHKQTKNIYHKIPELIINRRRFENFQTIKSHAFSLARTFSHIFLYLSTFTVRKDLI